MALFVLVVGLAVTLVFLLSAQNEQRHFTDACNERRTNGEQEVATGVVAPRWSESSQEYEAEAKLIQSDIRVLSDSDGSGPSATVGTQHGSRAQPEDPSSSASSLIALNEARFADARALARECLGLAPLDVGCHHVLINSFTRTGEYGAELNQAIDDCLSVFPDDASCMASKVLAEVHARDLVSARRWLEQRNSLVGHPPYYLGRAILAEAEGDVSTACESYHSACRTGQPYACAQVQKLCPNADSPTFPTGPGSAAIP